MANDNAAAAATTNPSSPTGRTTAASLGGIFAPGLTAWALPAPSECFPSPIPESHSKAAEGYEKCDQTCVLPLQHCFLLPRDASSGDTDLRSPGCNHSKG